MNEVNTLNVGRQDALAERTSDERASRGARGAMRKASERMAPRCAVSFGWMRHCLKRASVGARAHTELDKKTNYLGKKD